ncbi:hypothetical protein ACI65C_009695 [Semiaphis heraclei]
MYVNPWIRKHSTIRQVIDKLLSINTNKTKKFDAMLNKKKHTGSSRNTAAATTTTTTDKRRKWFLMAKECSPIFSAFIESTMLSGALSTELNQDHSSIIATSTKFIVTANILNTI